MAAVTALKFLPALAALGLVVGVVKISLANRARAMRGLADRWGLKYIGPSAFRWRFSFGRRFLSLTKIGPAVPIPFPLGWWPANEIRQVWNQIEGEQAGASVVIFDCFIGEGRGMYRTFFAYKSDGNPLEIDARRERVIHSYGWTILYRTPFPLEVPWRTWSIGMQRIEDCLSKLFVGSEPQH